MEWDGDRSFVVLLADDSPADQALTRRALTRSSNHVEFFAVGSGPEALTWLRVGGDRSQSEFPFPDVLLLDLNMPGLDGVEVLREIRADSKLRSLPVVVLTSSELDRDIAACYEFGVNAYIVKPVTLPAFERTMEEFKQFWFRNPAIRRPVLAGGELRRIP